MANLNILTEVIHLFSELSVINSSATVCWCVLVVVSEGPPLLFWGCTKFIFTGSNNPLILACGSKFLTEKHMSSGVWSPPSLQLSHLAPLLSSSSARFLRLSSLRREGGLAASSVTLFIHKEQRVVLCSKGVKDAWTGTSNFCKFNSFSWLILPEILVGA